MASGCVLRGCVLRGCVQIDVGVIEQCIAWRCVMMTINHIRMIFTEREPRGDLSTHSATISLNLLVQGLGVGGGGRDVGVTGSLVRAGGELELVGSLQVGITGTLVGVVVLLKIEQQAEHLYCNTKVRNHVPRSIPHSIHTHHHVPTYSRPAMRTSHDTELYPNLTPHASKLADPGLARSCTACPQQLAGGCSQNGYKKSLPTTSDTLHTHCKHTYTQCIPRKVVGALLPQPRTHTSSMWLRITPSE